MHDLNQLIVEWRRSLPAVPGLGPETLDELESHLRETVDQLAQSGMTESEAFERAVRQLGAPTAIAAEFQKVNRSGWLPAKLAAGTGVTAALALAVLLLAGLRHHPSSLLLASHVFAVTLGYVTTFLMGALGICFVCQRCCADFSPFRLRSLSRVSFNFASAALGLTAVGVVLGMFWARQEWGRFWAWDPKEIGGLCVVIWLACVLFAHRTRRATTRGIFLLSVLGNIIVSLAWFGPALLGGLHSYGMPHLAPVLLAATLGNVAFFLVGLAPAGWLRLSKA